MLMLINVSKGQLPLVYGDAVATHSQQNVMTSSNRIVLRTIKTNNTVGAPLGTNWDNVTAGTKQPNWNAPNWIFSTLGNIFGITLDTQPIPNIYVSNTQIYSGSGTNTSNVWRLDGTTGANTLVFDFANTSKSLGNLKYLALGNTHHIYVSNFENGKIEHLTGNPTGTTAWTQQTAFNPKYGLAVDDATFIPYGLGIRKEGANYRLYYSKTGNTTATLNTCEIWSVELDASGGFNIISERKENLPPLSLNRPIADIDFTTSGKKMLIGQQFWYPGFANLFAHSSNVYEFIIDTASLSNWLPSGNTFPSGGSGHTNSVGGVSYSSNVLLKDKEFACDTTVYFTSDYISTSPKVIYGVVGMKPKVNLFSDGIFIDEDDNTLSYDKMQLGDIEIYKKPLNCNPCTCGKWESNPTLNGVAINGVPIIYHQDFQEAKSIKAPIGTGPIGPAPMLQNYPIQFVQGNVSGVLNANYLCNGNCGATYSWTIKDATSTSITSGTTLPIDLAKYNAQLKCGKYTLEIKSKCGDSNCESLIIPITIICEPANCCKAQIDIDLEKISINAETNLSGKPYSTVNLNYVMNFSLPMSEVRVSVEEFQLKSKSPNCLTCNNRPVTWGNILAASINGSNMPLSGNMGMTTGNIAADYREAVYNIGVPLSPSSAGLNIQLSLPTITDLSCCEVTAYVCLKFTFKDTQCRECVQMVCGEIKLVPSTGTGVDNNNPINKIQFKNYEIKH